MPTQYDLSFMYSQGSFDLFLWDEIDNTPWLDLMAATWDEATGSQIVLVKKSIAPNTLNFIQASIAAFSSSYLNALFYKAFNYTQNTVWGISKYIPRPTVLFTQSEAAHSQVNKYLYSAFAYAQASVEQAFKQIPTLFQYSQSTILGTLDKAFDLLKAFIATEAAFVTKGIYQAQKFSESIFIVYDKKLISLLRYTAQNTHFQYSKAVELFRVLIESSQYMMSPLIQLVRDYTQASIYNFSKLTSFIYNFLYYAPSNLEMVRVFSMFRLVQLAQNSAAMYSRAVEYLRSNSYAQALQSTYLKSIAPIVKQFAESQAMLASKAVNLISHYTELALSGVVKSIDMLVLTAQNTQLLVKKSMASIIAVMQSSVITSQKIIGMLAVAAQGSVGSIMRGVGKQVGFAQSSLSTALKGVATSFNYLEGVFSELFKGFFSAFAYLQGSDFDLEAFSDKIKQFIIEFVQSSGVVLNRSISLTKLFTQLESLGIYRSFLAKIRGLVCRFLQKDGSGTKVSASKEMTLTFIRVQPCNTKITSKKCNRLVVAYDKKNVSLKSLVGLINGSNSGNDIF